VLEYLRPHLDLYKVDLKSFDDRHYRELGGRLQPILDTVRWLHDAGIWIEIVTLLVPGFNAGDTELAGLTEFIAGVSPDIPWHVTAFHQDYRMNDPANTTPAMLERAARFGRDAGLRYVYAGNLPGRVGTLEHTSCHSCGRRLIARYGYLIHEYNLTPDGACPQCGTALPGRWAPGFTGQRTAFPFLPADRTRLRVI
jgi:pyruvate formate lyase activating enzyme